MKYMTPKGPGAHNPILFEFEFTVPLALMLRDRNILLPSTTVTLEIKGSTRAPVLRRGGRTDKGIRCSLLKLDFIHSGEATYRWDLESDITNVRITRSRVLWLCRYVCGNRPYGFRSISV